MKASRKMSLRTRFIVLLPWDGKSYLVWSTGERNRCRKAHILIAPSSSSPNTPQNWTKFPPTLSGVRRVHMMIEYKSAEVSLSQARDSPPKLPTYTPGFEWTSRIQLQPSWKSGRSPRYIDIDTGIQPCRYRDIYRKRERERGREGGKERCCITRPWQSPLCLLQGIRKGSVSEYFLKNHLESSLSYILHLMCNLSNISLKVVDFVLADFIQSKEFWKHIFINWILFSTRVLVFCCYNILL